MRTKRVASTLCIPSMTRGRDCEWNFQKDGVKVGTPVMAIIGGDGSMVGSFNDDGTVIMTSL